jgi:hypothetical protein
MINGTVSPSAFAMASRIARPSALLIVAFTGGGGLTLPLCGASGWALPAIIDPGRGRAETAHSPKG